MPTRSATRFQTWFTVALVSLVLSAAAVATVRFASLNPLLAGLSHAAEAFASPGEFLWWATLGGAFAGYPSAISGHFIWVLGTALFWFLVAMLVIAVRFRWRQWLAARRY